MADNQLEDVLHCSICLELYTDPHILKCLHTFCKDCLIQLSKTQNKCPECREIFRPGDPKKDFKTQKLLDMYNSKHENKGIEKHDGKPQVRNACELCNCEVIEWGCTDCNKLLCNGCKSTHMAIPACSNHNLQSVETTAAPMRARLKETHSKLLCVKKIIEEKQGQLQNTKFNLMKNLTLNEQKIEAVERAFLQDAQEYFKKLKEKVKEQYTPVIDGAIQEEANYSKGQQIFHMYCRELENVMEENDIKKIIYRSNMAVGNVDRCIEEFYSSTKQSELTTKSQTLKKEYVVQYFRPLNFDNIISHNIENHKGQSSEVKNTPQFMPAANSTRKQKSLRTVKKAIHSVNSNTFSKVSSVQREDVKVSSTVTTDMVSNVEKAMQKKFKPKIKFDNLLGTPLELSTSCPVHSTTEEYFKMTVIDSEIWLTLSDKIEIYSLDGSYRRSFTNECMGNPNAVLKVNSNMILVASTKGLLHFDEKEQFVVTVTAEKFVDIANITGIDNAICGIDMWNQVATAFRHDGMQWQSVGKIKLGEEISDMKDTVVATKDFIYVCSFQKACIYQHNTNGTGLGIPYSMKPHHNHPRLCGIDSDHTILVTDKENHKISTVKFVSNDKKADVQHILCKMADLSPVYAGVDGCGALWVLSALPNSVLSKIQKFENLLEASIDNAKLDKELSMEERFKLLETISK